MFMALRYERDIPLDPARVALLYESAGLNRPTRDLERIATMLRHANLTFTAWDGPELVGISRSLTDFCWTCYLADLAVARSYQGKGIGRELVRLTREVIGPGTALVLNSAPTAMSYYPQIGFERLETAFTIRRR